MKNIHLVLIAVIVIGGGFYFFYTPQQVAEDQNEEVVVGDETSEPIEDEMVGEAPLPTNSIVGTWQSTQDPKFIRTIYENGGYSDTYVGDPEASENGPWVTFTKANAPESLSFPLKENTTYLQLSGDVILHFEIVSVTDKVLTMIYLNRGNVLEFVRIDQ